MFVMLSNIDFNLIWQLILEWYWLPIFIIYVAVIVAILLGNGNPTKTKAWIMVIVAFPIGGIILYYFFGQNFKKENYFKIMDKKSSKKFAETWNNFSSRHVQDFDEIEKRIGYQVKVFNYLNNTYTSLPMLNNRVKLLINGEQKFPLFLDAIKNAKHHIHLEYYIFEYDTIGKKVVDLLIEKANEGVEVRITTDDFGSSKFNKIVQKKFKNTSIQFQSFLPVRFTSLANSNFRNHRKVLIVDGHLAFVGGINISDKYINNQHSELYWRDTAVMIEGDSVNLLQFKFWMDWQMTEGKSFDVSNYDYMPITDPNIGNAIVGYSYTSPAADLQSGIDSLILAIYLAKKKVRLITPYFIPSEEFVSALLIAVNRGVEVELILPKKGDSKIVQEASFSFLKKFMKNGVQVYLYEKGFIHAKTVSIDDDLAFIGTMNLDNRSFYINFEITSIIHDIDLIQELNHQFDIDKLDSSILTHEMWKNMPIHKRAFASICRLLAPLL